MGLSGGGWTTTLIAALDTRIQHSYPVAGSLPLYLRNFENRNWGDYEQWLPSFYESIEYLDLYVMGAHGAGRSQTQTLLKFDTCCFGLEETPAYVASVQDAVRTAGSGSFDFWLDDTVINHLVSPCVMERILDDLEEKREFVAKRRSSGP